MKRFRFLSPGLSFAARPPERSVVRSLGSVRSIGGFTILEVMTVVAIIAILSGIAVYSINTNLDRIKADTAVRRVGFALNYARIRAVSENCNYVVSFRTRTTIGKDQSKCYIEMLADTDNDGVKDTNEKIRTEDLPKGIVYDLVGLKDIYDVSANADNRDGIAFPSNKVTFLPRGNASTKGEIYIIPETNIKKNLNDNRRAVSLERLSGRTIAWFYSRSLADKGMNPWAEEGK
jgi:prepilin-type N-terminal cleavage/methylation domain-containing protein